MEQDLDKIITLTSQIRKLMLQQSKVSFEEKVATMLQMQALTFLAGQPKTKMSEIASHLQTSFSSATQIIERMVQAGFITRVNDDNDRRVVQLSVTSAGVNQLKELKKAKKEQMKKLLAKVDANDMKELIRIQEKMLQSLQEKSDI